MFPLGGMGAPEDVALATLFFASDSSSWLTSITLDVSGGRSMLWFPTAVIRDREIKMSMRTMERGVQ